MRRALLSAVLSVCVLLSTFVAAQDASYTFTTIDVPGAMSTLPQGINGAGQIVGSFGDGNGAKAHSFVTDGATFTTIDVPRALRTLARGINNNGQIVGSFSDETTGNDHGFVTDGTSFTTLDVPGGRNIEAFGINRDGKIVGAFFDATGFDFHGFVTDGTSFTTLDVPGAVETLAFGINRDGKIVGRFRDTAGVTHGFVTDGVTFTTIDVPGAVYTLAYGINGAGQIVGSFGDAAGTHGFVTDGTSFTTIDVPSAMSTLAFGINGAGQIVGAWSSYFTFVLARGFVATPDGADTSPPVVTISASPATLWPPNGQWVTVMVSGTITDNEPGGSGVSSAAYQVSDEYGQIQPSGSLTLAADGRYSFTVALPASRKGNDQDGRQYMIAVSADDNTENLSSASATVTVPHK